MDDVTKAAGVRHIPAIEQEVDAKFLVTSPINEVRDNMKLIEVFDELVNVSAQPNKPATTKLPRGLSLVFHASNHGEPQSVFTFIDEVKVMRIRKQPLTFTIVGRRDDGCNVWLTVVLMRIDGQYLQTNVRSIRPGSEVNDSLLRNRLWSGSRRRDGMKGRN